MIPTTHYTWSRWKLLWAYIIWNTSVFYHHKKLVLVIFEMGKQEHHCPTNMIPSSSNLGEDSPCSACSLFALKQSILIFFRIYW